MTPQLSIVTPAAGGRYQRIKAVLSRLELNAKRHQKTLPFEFILVDNSEDQEYRALATSAFWSFPIKYVFLPSGGTNTYVNPAFPRNVGFRVAEGKVFTMIDADHWVHEDFVLGALESQVDRPCLKIGFMIDTSGRGQFGNTKGSVSGFHYRTMWALASRVSSLRPWLIRLINQNLMLASETMSFSECMGITGISGPQPWDQVWLISYPANAFFHIGGYDEQYLKGYGREDDDIFHRLRNTLPIDNSSMAFSGVHLWHPQQARNSTAENPNDQYFSRRSSLSITRNQGHEWGKLTKGAFSILGGKRRGFLEHEQWIAEHFAANENRPDYLNSSPWRDSRHLKRSIIDFL